MKHLKKFGQLVESLFDDAKINAENITTLDGEELSNEFYKLAIDMYNKDEISKITMWPEDSYDLSNDGKSITVEFTEESEDGYKSMTVRCIWNYVDNMCSYGSDISEEDEDEDEEDYDYYDKEDDEVELEMESEECATMEEFIEILDSVIEETEYGFNHG